MIPNNLLNDCTKSKIDAIEITGKATAIVPDAAHATVADIQAVLNKLPKNAEIISIGLDLVDADHSDDNAIKSDVQISIIYAASQAVENNLTATFRDANDSLQGISIGNQTGVPLTQRSVPFRKDI